MRRALDAVTTENIQGFFVVTAATRFRPTLYEPCCRSRSTRWSYGVLPVHELPAL